MNLVMPLKDKSPVGRAQAAMAIAQHKDAIYAGLNNVGTVHFARFVIVGDNICMFSVYDGDFTNYIRDFIATIGERVQRRGRARRRRRRSAARARRMSRPSSSGCTRATSTRCRTPPTDFLRDQEKPSNGDKAVSPVDDDLTLLPRQLVLQLRANANVSAAAAATGPIPDFRRHRSASNCGSSPRERHDQTIADLQGNIPARLQPGSLHVPCRQPSKSPNASRPRRWLAAAVSGDGDHDVPQITPGALGRTTTSPTPATTSA